MVEKVYSAGLNREFPADEPIPSVIYLFIYFPGNLAPTGIPAENPGWPQLLISSPNFVSHLSAQRSRWCLLQICLVSSVALKQRSSLELLLTQWSLCSSLNNSFHNYAEERHQYVLLIQTGGFHLFSYLLFILWFMDQTSWNQDKN